MASLRYLVPIIMSVNLACSPAIATDKNLPLNIAIDEAKLIRLGEDAAQIIVGNPAIADVTPQSARLLVVTGKSYGTTNLIALNAKGGEILNAKLGVSEGDRSFVTVYKGAVRQSLHCAPNCQRVLSIGDDKTQFEQLADTVSKKFGVVNSAMGGN